MVSQVVRQHAFYLKGVSHRLQSTQFLPHQLHSYHWLRTPGKMVSCAWHKLGWACHFKIAVTLVCRASWTGSSSLPALLTCTIKAVECVLSSRTLVACKTTEPLLKTVAVLLDHRTTLAFSKLALPFQISIWLKKQSASRKFMRPRPIHARLLLVKERKSSMDLVLSLRLPMM